MAVDDAMDNIEEIGLALRIKQNTIDEIKQIHPNNPVLCGILSVWLKGQHMKNGPPYTLHKDEKHKCPSWWNLVFVVAQQIEFQLADKIAKNYKGWLLIYYVRFFHWANYCAVFDFILMCNTRHKNFLAMWPWN